VALTGMAGASETVALELSDGASAVERECAAAIAELSGYRTQLERRKARLRAANARTMPAGFGSSRTSERTEEQCCAADRRALNAMRTSLAASLGGMGELLASCVELSETSHPELWQGTAEQQLLTEQIRQSQRLVHMLGRIQADFGGITNA
jgi:hypothetical protein